MEKIISLACEYFVIENEILMSKTRVQMLTNVRAHLSVFLTKYYNLKPAEIAKILQVDRTTVYFYQETFNKNTYQEFDEWMCEKLEIKPFRIYSKADVYEIVRSELDKQLDMIIKRLEGYKGASLSNELLEHLKIQ